MTPTLYGIDFTSAPRRAKPIVVARARSSRDPHGEQPGVVRVDALHRLTDFTAFEAFLGSAGPWLGAFDLPFGLPRPLMAAWGWCGVAPCATDPGWPEVMRRLEHLDRRSYVAALRGYCDARPAGAKFAHRGTDAPAGSSPSMKWVNPPVALMLHSGATRLARAGVRVPGLHDVGDPSRLAFEAYPGLVARALIGRTPYKSDDRARQTPERAQARARLLHGLTDALAPSGPWRPSDRLELDPVVARDCLDDPTGDSLDAVLCVALAAWAWRRRECGWGLPVSVDPLEGWILAAPADPPDAGGPRPRD